MKWQIALGMLLVLASMGVLGFVAVGEENRMAEFTRSNASRNIEAGATLFESSCRPCHGPQGMGIEGVAPAINAPDLFNGERLRAMGFGGTVEDYLAGVIAAGRPVPSAGTNYPQRMPTWSRRFGGPLRDDEIETLVAFIMNWEDRALAQGQPTPAAPVGGTVGTDTSVSLPQGDPGRGKSLSEGALGCAGCHVLAAVGPSWMAQGGEPGVGGRASQRIQAPDYTGSAKTPEQYLFESVVLPDVYVEEGYQPNIMPKNFGDRLSPQDMADLIAYMLSLR